MLVGQDERHLAALVVVNVAALAEARLIPEAKATVRRRVCTGERN